ncbi:MAG: transporter [Erythrobacter sp. SCN 62-14]|nr:MAG: transporter [Erythrobacter sp. SCN 62-14]
MMRFGACLLLLSLVAPAALVLPAAPGAAQDIAPVGEPMDIALRQGTLLPQQVLRSSSLTFPAILEAFEREAAARGDQLSADGAFDLMLRGEVFDRITGTFDGGFASTEARQALRPLGAEVFASYRVARGRFPTSESGFNTTELGQMRIGAMFSLLRDRRIDQRRFAIEDTRLAAGQASIDVLLVQLNVQAEALRAYWRWVAAGEEVRVFEELLEIAEARQVGLARGVREGATAEIALTENEQNLLRRRTLLEEARRNFETAANSLSFFLRDSSGQMIVPRRAQIPSLQQIARLPTTDELLAAPRNEVLERRPELRTLRLASERAANRIELRRNDLQPSLQGRAEVRQSFGDGPVGMATFDSATDTLVGLTFSVPLQRREARGRLARAEAELRELELRERRIADQIEVEIDNILATLNAAIRVSSLAQDEVRQATTMVQAERTRFRLGAGDFFLVNLREEAAADAQVRAIRAELSGRLAAANYNAATINLPELGLE